MSSFGYASLLAWSSRLGEEILRFHDQFSEDDPTLSRKLAEMLIVHAIGFGIPFAHLGPDELRKILEDELDRFKYAARGMNLSSDEPS